MDAAADRPEFEPPKEPGLLRGFALAVLAHLLLVFALMHGLQWKRESDMAVAEAELWSALPQQAAPKEVPTPPAPPPPPAPPVVKAPPPPPPAVEPPAKRDADIALEREKEKRELERKKQAELEKQRDERRKLEAQKKKREQELAEKRREEELEKKKEQELAKKRQEQELAKKREAEQEKKEQQAKLAEARRKEEEKKRKDKEREERDAKRVAQLREENLKRMQGMAGGTGSPDANGSAARASGPSASWGAKVQARVRPNIVFSDPVSGNPKAEVEVRTSPDGTIVGKRLVRSSGVSSWDEAVLRALEKTESLPRDTDGRVPSPVVITFRPKG